MAKVYSLTIRNRVAATALAVTVVGLGIVFLTVGFALLAGLAVAGTLIGGGFAIYNRLRGRDSAQLRAGYQQRIDLDPTLEIRPVEPPLIRPRPDDESDPRDE